MSTPPGDVRAAFTILLDEINATVEAMNQDNMRAIAERNYDKVLQLTERARAMDQFRERVNALQHDWQALVQGVTHPGGARPVPQPGRPPAPPKRAAPHPRDGHSTQKTQHAKRHPPRGAAAPPPPPAPAPPPPPPPAPDPGDGDSSQNTHLAKGLRTPEDAFRLPILRALVQLGGSGKMQAVLDLVHEEMAPQLNHHDYEPIPSNPNLPRWQNSTQWCRAKLIRDGALRSDSARGLWEISNEGRAWAAQDENPAQPPSPPAASPSPAAPSNHSQGDAARAPVGRTQGTHLAKGLRTPEDAYRVPILRALVQLDGRGRMAKVLELVREQMAGQLNHHDYEGLPSLPKVPRWRNNTQWCRAKLIEEGLLRSDSDYGYWEITDEGRAWLSAHNAAPPAHVLRSMPPAPPAQPDNAAGKLIDESVDAAIQSPVAKADWAFIEQGLLPQLLADVVMVFRLMHHGGFTYASAAGAVAARRGLSTVNTIYDACTRRLGLTAAQFRELADSPTRLHERLAGFYPAFDTYLYELLIDAF